MKTKVKKLVRITTIYGETFIRVELKRDKIGIYTDCGFIPFCDISFIDIIGEFVGDHFYD